MVNLTTNIPAAAAVEWVKKWKVTYHNDNDNLSPPCLVVGVTLYDRISGVDVPWPIGQQILYLRDSVPSQVLVENGSATSMHNQFLAANVALSGTPYTAITNAINAATGKNAIRLAIEGLLVSAGALPASFAGT